MSDFHWHMTDESIVNKAPGPEEPQGFKVAPFEKPKPGQRLAFDVSVVATPMAEGPLMKKAVVSVNLPGWGDWEIICDEGVTGGGLDSAPAPLMYFSAGVAFCLMTHIQLLAMQKNIKLEDLRVEQRSTFSTQLSLGGEQPEGVKGAGDLFETHIFVKCSEPEDKLQAFMRACEDACMAGQAVANATPKHAYLHFNDQPAVEV